MKKLIFEENEIFHLKDFLKYNFHLKDSIISVSTLQINENIFDNCFIYEDKMNVNKVADNIYEIPPKTLKVRIRSKIEKFREK